MTGFAQFKGGARRTTLLALLALLTFGGLRDVPLAHAQTGNVTITKELVDANGNVVAGNLSGYVFTLTPPGGGAAQTLPPTNAQGQTTAQVAVGSYTAGEQARSGATLVGFFTEGVPTVSFSVTANQKTALTARNRVAGTGVIAFAKTVIDANDNPVGGDRSGFQFTISGPNGFNQTVTTEPNSFASLGNLADGTYTITEQPRAGYTLENFRIRGVTVSNGATVTLSNGETVAVAVTNRIATSATEQVQLFKGCNNVSSTYPNGTATSNLASNVSPAGALAGIWFFVNSQQRFVGFSPIPGAPNDLVTVNRSDALFICMNAGGTFTRPTL